MPDLPVRADGIARGTAGDGVPEQGRAPTIVDDDQPAVGREGHPVDWAIMARQGLDRAASGRLPEPDRPILAPCHYPRAIGREPGDIDGAAVPKRLAVELSGVEVPEPRLAVAAGGQDQAPIEGEVGVSGGVSADRQTDWSSRRGLPDPRRRVASPGQEEPAVVREFQGPDRYAVDHDRTVELAGRRRPAQDPAVGTAGEHPTAVWRERSPEDIPAVIQGRSDRFAGRRRPESRLAIVTGGQDGAAVGAELGGAHRPLMFEDRAEAGRRPAQASRLARTTRANAGCSGGACRSDSAIQGIARSPSPRRARSRPRSKSREAISAWAWIRTPRLGGPRLDLGDGQPVGAASFGIGAAPEHGHGRESRQEHRHQGQEQSGDRQDCAGTIAHPAPRARRAAPGSAGPRRTAAGPRPSRRPWRSAATARGPSP